MAMTTQPISSRRMDMSERTGGLVQLQGLEDLYGEDLWDVVISPQATARLSSDAVKKWKRLNAKAEFALKRSISHGLFNHTTRCKSAHEIWQTLDR
ncbi:hypothetical protein CDL15_Pgr009294 [Punica granatum]|uniref:Uncharacterized protein n=1 Tax=Punica granatum TaxID=22663 RepID=A0A218XGF4_PUNGR|nr:hypothetical protein CDL15_Pgr009294 [Punica granatum]